MHGKQKGFTLIEILVVVTIIGVLAGLVVVLIPKGRFEANKTDCMNNIRNMCQLLEVTGGSKYPEYSGPNLILYLVKRKEIGDDADSLKLMFCPGDLEDSLKSAGGTEAYDNLDLKKTGEFGHLTSYAARDQLNKDCVAKKGTTKPSVLVCDDSEDHHDNKGVVVGLTGGAVKWRHKLDDYDMDLDAALEIGENSAQEELRCLRGE